MNVVDIVERLRERIAIEIKYQQGEGCADLLEEAADVIEQQRKRRTAGSAAVMNCKDCRFWAGNLNDDDELEGLAAVGPSHPREAWPCMNPKIGGDYNGDEHKAPDAANSYETIITGPMFGCVHFEVKNELH